MVLPIETRASAQEESPGACCCAARGAAPAQPRSRIPERDAAFGRDMVRIPGGTFRMGSDRHYREERPARVASVEEFWIDVHPVTNRQFARFVEATGYVSVAERVPEAACYPDADPALLVPGSLVFARTRGPVSLRDFRQWWRYVPGASWSHPEGPGSDTIGREEHPVVHVTYEDALAYAAWAGQALPTEAEWERAARGGLEGADYPWGDEFAPAGQLMANVWLGRFPWESHKPGGAVGTSPVRSFPPNAYGLYDVVGNVWEWTTTAFAESSGPRGVGSCCLSPSDADPSVRRVVKGGSHLCTPSYCLRYRPAARQGQTLDTSTSHIGFRCVVREGRRGAA
jgi:formylglycine-generating enzyme